MMKISIIIVNYNVRSFLEQCLYTVRNSVHGIDSEVIVIDNNSMDGSCESVLENFPEVKLICNKFNAGFSKANNQGIECAKGEYVLLLNPDTVLEENTIPLVVEFMDKNPESGALGVKMIDGTGKYLPESKRSLPTPRVAFYKVFGLSSMFPKSKEYGRYHLSYLDKDEVHEVDVLSGAFMLIRKTVLDQIGGLDERFFMYGEDIDLSYRVQKAGFKNYYFPETQIIHYKGESTKKGSINYVFVFYRAMILFAEKHFTGKQAKLFSTLINFAIYLRAGVSLCSRIVSKGMFPMVDFVLAYSGLHMLKIWYQGYTGILYPEPLITYAFISFSLTWTLSIWFWGGYDLPVRIPKVVKGIVYGICAILIIYALLPENFRFSRALTLLGSLWLFLTGLGFRYFINLFGLKNLRIRKNSAKRLAIVGSDEEIARIKLMFSNLMVKVDYIAGISPETNDHPTGEQQITGINYISEAIRIFKLNEVIFCLKDISSEQIMDKMTEIPCNGVEFKIASGKGTSIIGSNSVHDSGEIYALDHNRIDQSDNRRFKRSLDILVAISIFISCPVLLIIVPNPGQLLKNALQVLLGEKTWVGFFTDSSTGSVSVLPKLKNGVLFPVEDQPHNFMFRPEHQTINRHYAREYSPAKDMKFIMRGWRFLGSKDHQPI